MIALEFAVKLFQLAVKDIGAEDQFFPGRRAGFGARSLATIRRMGGRLARETLREVSDQGVAESKIKTFVRAHIRYAGTDTALIVPAFGITSGSRQGKVSLAAMKSAFERAHRSQFGFIDRSNCYSRMDQHIVAFTRVGYTRQTHFPSHAGKFHRSLDERWFNGLHFDDFSGDRQTHLSFYLSERRSPIVLPRAHHRSAE